MYKIKNDLLIDDIKNGYLADFINEVEKLTSLILDDSQGEHVQKIADYIRKNFYNSESPLTDKEKFKKAFNNIYENLAIIYTICKNEDKKDLNAINDQLFNVLTSQLNNISNRE